MGPAVGRKVRSGLRWRTEDEAPVVLPSAPGYNDLARVATTVTAASSLIMSQSPSPGS